MRVLDELVSLARDLGGPNADLALLAEGNCSARADESTFWVKASGAQMAQANRDAFVRVAFQPILAALDHEALSVAETRTILNNARVEGPPEAIPSTEAFMHAVLLGIEGARFVGHTHPTDLLALLVTNAAEECAGQRLFPDEIVCCGPSVCYVPYTMPGHPLARAIRTAMEGHDQPVRTLWLQNHGLIVLGSSPVQVMSGSLMAAKVARVWLRAFATHRPLHPLTPEQVAAIDSWPDEHYRRERLGK